MVENQVDFLRQSSDISRIVLMSGPRVDGLSEQTLGSSTQQTLDNFDYDADSTDPAGNRSRAASIVRELSQRLESENLTPDDTVLHWHNHSLGKNTAAPLVIAELAQRGWPILLQVHDFAEDNRPENFRRLIEASGASDKYELDQFLYPTHDKIHYAALTDGDTQALTTIGCKTFLLFNSVKLPSGPMPSQAEAIEKVRSAFALPSDASWIVYPVRGIRRKNVGEWLLLTQLLPEGWYSGLTLKPTTPVEQKSYQRWQHLAQDVAPRAIFDAGHHDDVSFAENLSASSKVFSTSVAEGFGMTYLEPWLAQREVIARRLPGVTSDFEQSGVQLDSFYDAIPIPGSPDWISESIGESQDAMDAAINQIPKPFRPRLVSIDQQNDAIDFAVLTPRRQSEVLRRMASDSGFADEVRSRSSGLLNAIARPPDLSLIQANANVIATRYSIDAVGKRLIEVYHSVLQSDRLPVDRNQASTAVDLVNQNRPFYPCRTESQFHA